MCCEYSLARYDWTMDKDKDNHEGDEPASLRSLSELLFEGSAAFNHLAWKTQPTFSVANARDDLASLHEWCHHELDNTTTYGLLLVYYATLSRHAIAHQDRFNDRLKELVSQCAVSHEVFATWYSVQLLRDQNHINALLDLLPKDYLAFYDQGEHLVSGISSVFLKQQVFLTVLRSCFEAATFYEFPFAQAERFRLSDVRALDLPDPRLQIISRSIEPRHFEQWTVEYYQNTSPRNAAAIRRSTELPQANGLDHLPLAEADAILGDFLSWLSAKWNDWLARERLSTNPYENHLKRLNPLVENANKRCGRTVLTAATSNTTAPPSHHSLLRQAESEVVYNLKQPMPITFTPVSTLSNAQRANLPVGNNPRHILVQARTLLSLRQQHLLDPEFFPDQEDASPIVFIRRRTVANNPEQTSVTGYFFDQPALLDDVLATDTETTKVGLVSSSLLTNQPWQNLWINRSILWAIKIDHSLCDFLNQHCRSQAEVRYSISSIKDGDRVVRFLCFLTLADAQSNWQLFLGCCSDNMAKASIEYIKLELDSNRVHRDDTPFNTDLAPLLTIVSTHLIRDEYFFSFDHLGYS